MSGRESPTSGTQWCASVTSVVLAALLAAMIPRTAASQTQYYNLDSNRPLRVEDALPTERRSLDTQLAPLRLDALGAGTRRWRIEPKLSYGIAALTEVELRVPVLFVQPGDPTAAATLGLTISGLGVMHALNTETARWPALALSGEVLVPAGLLAPPNASYGVKGLLTETMSFGRVSLNAAYGTYSVIPAPPVSPTCRLLPPGAPGCNGRPTVPDVPCTRVPIAGSMGGMDVDPSPENVPPAPAFAAVCLTGAAATPASQRSVGDRWFAGGAVDHTFALASTLIGADLFAERLVGLSSLVDWTAEIGLRHQWSSRLV